MVLIYFLYMVAGHSICLHRVLTLDRRLLVLTVESNADT